ncbi:MAG: flagellar hook-length control protein FliK [Rhodobacteraceae bacterium]|nr:flagellar hook-length control protein FliK [Paracoccaceae bacterium]
MDHFQGATPEPSGGPKTDDIEPLGPAAEHPKIGQGRLLATDPDIVPTKPAEPNASGAEDRPDMPTIPQKEMKGTATEDPDPPVFESDPFTLVVADGSFPQMSTLSHSVATGPRAPSLAAHVLAQLTATVSQTENGATEIRLDPEELGRVRLVMQSHDTNMTVIVQAERPETAVLLRRHIDQLVQDVRALGYENVTIDFGGHGQRNQDRGASDFQHVQQSDPPSGGGNTTTSEIQDTRRTRSRAIGAAGLDMRL